MVAGTAAIIVLAVACSTAPTYQDKGGVEGALPDETVDVDYTKVYRNADGAPTIVISCVEGVAFASPASQRSGGETYSVGGTYFFVVPEFNNFCKTKTVDNK
jgi:hypothetical protein